MRVHITAKAMASTDNLLLNRLERHLDQVLSGKPVIDTDSLPSFLKTAVERWIQQHADACTFPEPEPKPVSVVDRPVKIEIAPINEDRDRDVKLQIGLQQAEQRLKDYEAEGLIMNDHNRNQIANWIRVYAYNFWCRENVEAAVVSLNVGKHLQYAPLGAFAKAFARLRK
jgi:hypothetical protein